MPSKEQHFTLRQQREVLYGKVERKIAILKDLWLVARALRTPSANDLFEDEEAERLQLTGVMHTAVERVPEAAAEYRRYKELATPQDEILLRKSLGYLQIESSEEVVRSPNYSQAQSLLENEDIRFLVSLDWVHLALQKRATIRTVLREIGNDAQVDAYADYLPEELSDFRGKILQAHISPFSINLFVEGEAFKEQVKDEDTIAFHLDGTIWNVLNSSRFLSLFRLFAAVSLQGKREEYVEKLAQEGLSGDPFIIMLETIHHEDFHSFSEGFLPQFSEDSDNGNSDIMDDITEAIFTLSLFRARDEKFLAGLEKEHINPSEIMPFYRPSLQRWEDLIINLHYEELLTELASAAPGNAKISEHSTFIGEMEARKGSLESYIHALKAANPRMEESLDVARFATRIARFLNSEKTISFVNNTYEQIAERAPEKIGDLDMAFALFPLTRWGHIKRLVRRWTSL